MSDLTRTNRQARWSHWSTGISAGLFIVALGLWITSYFGVIWAAPTLRHRFSLVYGALIADVQSRSMPTSLPANAMQSELRQASLPPTGQIYFIRTSVTPPTKFAFFQPGWKVRGFEAWQRTWIPKY